MSHFQGDSCPGRHCPNIALSGPMRSGKDSIADWLVENRGYTKIGFAQELKKEVARGVGCDPNELDIEPLRTLIRPILQLWGTEFRRTQNPGYWVDRLEETLLLADEPLVVTDARFINELELLEGHQFVLVRIEMPDAEVVSYLQQQGLSDEVIATRLSHPSETEWKTWLGFATTIHSKRGDMDGLYQQVLKVLERNLR